MKGKALVITTIVIVVVLMGVSPVTGQSGENENLENYYKNYISKCITKYQSKTSLQTSKSANLRSCGALSKQKVVFLTNNQNTLVNEMIQNKIGTRPYKIDHYLNSRFYETIK